MQNTLECHGIELNINVRMRLHLQNGLQHDGTSASPTNNLQASMSTSLCTDRERLYA